MTSEDSIGGGEAIPAAATPLSAETHSPVVHGPTIWVSSLAVLVAQMCLTILAAINGLIQRELGASATHLTWLSAAIFAPTALLELNFGVLGDIFGRKKLMVMGLGLVVIGAAVGTQVSSIPMLAVALVLMGLGAAVLLPSTLASVAEFSPGKEERAHALSRWALAISLGAALSPLAAALMAGVGGLGYAFIPVGVIALVSLVLVAALARDSRSVIERSLDWPGQILIIVGLMAFIYAIIQGAEGGFGQPIVIVALVVAFVGLPLFAWVELRSPNPMFQVRLLQRPAFAAAAVAGLLGMLSFLGSAYAVSIKLGAIAQAPLLEVAMPFVLVQLIPLLLAKWLPGLVHKVSPRILLASGLALMAGGQVWLAMLPDGETDLLPMAPPILLLGVGFIVMFTSLTAAAINSVPHEYIGMASGATSLVRETGQTLGAAVVGAVALSTAGALLEEDLGAVALPPEAMGVVHEVNGAAGALGLANAPLPDEIREVVAPIAVNALERGFDLGLFAMAACSVLAAVVVLILMRNSGADVPDDAAPVVAP